MISYRTHSGLLSGLGETPSPDNPYPCCGEGGPSIVTSPEMCEGAAESLKSFCSNEPDGAEAFERLKAEKAAMCCSNCDWHRDIMAATFKGRCPKKPPFSDNRPPGEDDDSGGGGGGGGSDGSGDDEKGCEDKTPWYLRWGGDIARSAACFAYPDRCRNMPPPTIACGTANYDSGEPGAPQPPPDWVPGWFPEGFEPGEYAVLAGILLLGVAAAVAAGLSLSRDDQPTWVVQPPPPRS